MHEGKNFTTICIVFLLRTHIIAKLIYNDYTYSILHTEQLTSKSKMISNGFHSDEQVHQGEGHTHQTHGVKLKNLSHVDL